MYRPIRGLLAACLIALLAAPAYAERNLPREPGAIRYRPMVDQLRALLAWDQSAGDHRMALDTIGETWTGRHLWMVTLHAASAAPEQTRRVFYLCRQHGHEPASTQAALDFVDRLVHAPAGSALADDLTHVTVYVVPMANPDGSDAFLRHNAHDIDLNRDWEKQTQPETQALESAIERIHPDIMTDQHELYPNDARWDFVETVGFKAGAAPSVAGACVDLGNTIRYGMWTAGYKMRSTWIDDQHPARLAHRYGCLDLGIPTILFETNREKGRRRSLAARAAAHEEFMALVLRDAAGQAPQILEEARAAGVYKPSAQDVTAASGAPAAHSPAEDEGQ